MSSSFDAAAPNGIVSLEAGHSRAKQAYFAYRKIFSNEHFLLRQITAGNGRLIKS